MMTQTGRRASFSIFSIAAVVCAVLSFASGGGLGLLFAVLAIGSGAIGVLLAFLPGTRGGVMSFAAAIAGLVGIGVAIAKLATSP